MSPPMAEVLELDGLYGHFQPKHFYVPTMASQPAKEHSAPILHTEPKQLRLTFLGQLPNFSYSAQGTIQKNLG